MSKNDQNIKLLAFSLGFIFALLLFPSQVFCSAACRLAVESELRYINSSLSNKGLKLELKGQTTRVYQGVWEDHVDDFDDFNPNDFDMRRNYKHKNGYFYRIESTTLSTPPKFHFTCNTKGGCPESYFTYKPKPKVWEAFELELQIEGSRSLKVYLPVPRYTSQRNEGLQSFFDERYTLLELEYALSVFPQRHLANARTLEFAPFKPNGSWEKKYWGYITDEGGVADYADGYRILLFSDQYGISLTSRINETIIHELAHFLALRFWGKAEPSQAYKRAMAADGSRRPTEYAYKNDGEDLAESVTMLLTYPDRLKQDFPNRAAFIEKMLSKDPNILVSIPAALRKILHDIDISSSEEFSRVFSWAVRISLGVTFVGGTGWSVYESYFNDPYSY